MEVVPSPAHGLKLCPGYFSEMSDTDSVEVVRRFGERFGRCDAEGSSFQSLVFDYESYE